MRDIGNDTPRKVAQLTVSAGFAAAAQRCEGRAARSHAGPAPPPSEFWYRQHRACVKPRFYHQPARLHSSPDQIHQYEAQGKKGNFSRLPDLITRPETIKIFLKLPPFFRKFLVSLALALERNFCTKH